VFAFPFSAIFANWLSFILFKCSLHACLLILAHLMTSRISRMLRTSLSRILSRRVLPMMHLKVLKLYEDLLLLPHLLIGPCLLF